MCVGVLTDSIHARHGRQDSLAVSRKKYTVDIHFLLPGVLIASEIDFLSWLTLFPATWCQGTVAGTQSRLVPFVQAL